MPDGCLDLIVGGGRVFVAGPDTRLAADRGRVRMRRSACPPIRAACPGFVAARLDDARPDPEVALLVRRLELGVPRVADATGGLGLSERARRAMPITPT